MAQAKRLPSRAAAARVLQHVFCDGTSLSTLLPGLSDIAAAKDIPYIKAMVFGVCRYFHRLEPQLAVLLHKNLPEEHADIRALALCGLFQLQYGNVPQHAAVSETVNAVKALGKPWAKSLINGVLRQFLRRRNDIDNRLRGKPAYRYAHPQWLIDTIKKAWPTQAENIFGANNQQGPMSLRVNTLAQSRQDYLQQLRQQQIPAQPCKHAPAGVAIEQARGVETLPGFIDGAVSVQDEAAQLAAQLLQAASADIRLLDACAAPGGKTAHLAESYPQAQISAVEIDPQRMLMVADTLQRLNLSTTRVRCIQADAGEPDTWWEGRRFQRILIDAPCTATGVIRRHPDIKLLRRAADVADLAAAQARLLNGLWPLLEAGGILVYCTCSVLAEENSGQIEKFLHETDDAREIPIEARWGLAQSVGRQILPGQDDMDGFYYARVQKRNV